MPGGFKAILAGAVAALAGVWRLAGVLAARLVARLDGPEESPEERADRQDDQDRRAW